ncbi:MAG TPA: hypothetical protein VHF89_16350 [Solirubrobacteraceae bacterium]|nr:hypothetical protein [Solirubrobacteraceae bacterium]
MSARTVLLDVGGVLTSDPWQSILLTPRRGLADRLGLDRDVVERHAQRLWSRHSVERTDAATYWAELEEALGRPLPRELVGQLEEDLIEPGPYAERILREVAARSVRIGVISNNTCFWYPRQERLLGLDRYVDPDLVFLSCRVGVAKDSEPRGLFAVAADALEPPTTLVVDDKDKNVTRARACGFRAVRYEMHSPPDDLIDGCDGA